MFFVLSSSGLKWHRQYRRAAVLLVQALSALLSSVVLCRGGKRYRPSGKAIAANVFPQRCKTKKKRMFFMRYALQI